MVAQVINILYNIVERVYIGYMPGTGSMALTGVSVGVRLPVIIIVSAFAALVSTGSAPNALIYVGKRTMTVRGQYYFGSDRENT